MEELIFKPFTKDELINFLGIVRSSVGNAEVRGVEQILNKKITFKMFAK